MTQVITGNRVANNSITYDNLTDNVKSNFVTTVYDLDDMSYETDGFRTTFPLMYNSSTITVPSPWNLLVTISGIMQRGFANTNGYDANWQSYVIPAFKGYTLDSSGNIQFTDAPYSGADLNIRVVPGLPNANTKVYPFRPTDIMVGY
jgi:hypothetical protein